MNLTEATNHPLILHAKKELWGTGVISIPDKYEDEFYSLTQADQQLLRTFFTAATTSCPVPLTLANDSSYGPAYQEKRYSEVNFMYTYLKERSIDPKLGFGQSVDLSSIGERGLQDSGWVPENKSHTLEGPSTYFGYLIPRLVIDILKRVDYLRKESDCYIETDPSIWLFIIEAELSLCRNLYEAISLLVGELIFLYVDPEIIKQRVFDSGYRKEVPSKYLDPIYSQLNSILSPEYQFHG